MQHSLPKLTEDLSFSSLLTHEQVSKTLSLNASTPDLVAQAREIATQLDDNVLCEHDEHRVKTGALLRALLDHASKDTIPGHAPDVTGERHTAAVVVSAHEQAGTTVGNGGGKLREVALAWLEQMLLYGI